MTAATSHRLDGLEPDNLLAFLALLGLMHALERARPDWRVRVSWDVEPPPERPRLHLAAAATPEEVAEAADAGVLALAATHGFGDAKDLAFAPAEARDRLRTAAGADPHAADLWAALCSDAAASQDGKKVEATPFCMMFGQGHQHFLERLGEVPSMAAPPPRGRGRAKIEQTAAEGIVAALFRQWTRPDASKSFRWDSREDVRYALRATDPTDAKTKETTQHGANRLAAVGLSALTVAPATSGGRVRLRTAMVERSGGSVAIVWPIWTAACTPPAVRALLSHPGLSDPDVRAALSVVGRRRARRIASGKFMNVTAGEPL